MENQLQAVRRVIKESELENDIKLVNQVKNVIINTLRNNADFDMLFCEQTGCGVYEQNLKVIGNEFAFAIPLLLPSKEVKVIPDRENKGSVLLKVTLNKYSKHKFLKHMLNEDGYLLENKFQRWFEGRMTMNNSAEPLLDQGLQLQLKYIKQLPIHLIVVSGRNISFSIKFLPLFLFEAHNTSARRNATTDWEAIPRPNKIANARSFRTSYIKAESAIFANKNNLRCALQLMMKYRNSRPNMKSLKSYHLKSIFLWLNEERGCDFWKAACMDILREVFIKLQAALETKLIRFFWESELNLLDDVRTSQIESMNEEVKGTLQALRQPVVHLQHIFLTLSEQMKYKLQITHTETNVDRIFQAISSAININESRERYTNLYNFLRDRIIKGLKTDPNFKMLYSDLKLAGSYADNLKISKPNEFDLIVRLTLPHIELVDIYPDNSNRGNVLINLHNVLERLLDENNYDAYKFLKTLVNKEQYLLQAKVQSWLEGLFSRYVLSSRDDLKYKDGSMVHIRYSKQGPAHTITVKCEECEFSVDFVPGFCFEGNRSISKRTVPNSDVWEAIPKPIKGTTNNLSFRTSFADSERSIFLKRNQFKNVLRLMKKFRNMNPKLVHLKSYFLKTIFLWHSETCDPSFWCKPTFEIVKEMFNVVENALERKEIKFFWDDELNMLAVFTGTQIKSMYNEVKAGKQQLLKADSSTDILRLFLTKKEIAQLEEKEYI